MTPLVLFCSGTAEGWSDHGRPLLFAELADGDLRIVGKYGSIHSDSGASVTAACPRHAWRFVSEKAIRDALDRGDDRLGMEALPTALRKAFPKVRKMRGVDDVGQRRYDVQRMTRP